MPTVLSLPTAETVSPEDYFPISQLNEDGSTTLRKAQTPQFIISNVVYASSAPSGTPSTTGGAPIVYNTATHSLNIYDTVAGAWYHITLVSGAA
jgi:hypothetical protein